MQTKSITVSFNAVSVEGESPDTRKRGSSLPAVVSCNKRTLKLRKAGFLVYGNANDVAIVTRGNVFSSKNLMMF